MDTYTQDDFCSDCGQLKEYVNPMTKQVEVGCDGSHRLIVRDSKHKEVK